MDNPFRIYNAGSWDTSGKLPEEIQGNSGQ